MDVLKLVLEANDVLKALSGVEEVDPDAAIVGFMNDRLLYVNDEAETLLDLLRFRHFNLAASTMPVFAGELSERLLGDLPGEGKTEITPDGHGVSVPVAYSMKKSETPHGRVSICRLWKTTAEI